MRNKAKPKSPTGRKGKDPDKRYSYWKRQVVVYLTPEDEQRMQDMSPIGDRQTPRTQAFGWYMDWARDTLDAGRDRALLTIGTPEGIAAVLQALTGALSQGETGESLAQALADWFRLGDGADLGWQEGDVTMLVDALASLDAVEATGLFCLARYYSSRRANGDQVRALDLARTALAQATENHQQQRR